MKTSENEISHALLDMDGVIVNFVGGVEKKFDVDLSDLRGFQIPTKIGITPKAFWEKLHEDPRFWADLEPYPWARDLVNICLEKTTGNVTFTTSPDMSITCASQKVWWIAQHFPAFSRKFLIGPEKHLLAKPNHVLIDDSQRNIDLFREHGGQALAFPQLWNEVGEKPNVGSVEYISDKLDELIFVQ